MTSLVLSSPRVTHDISVCFKLNPVMYSKRDISGDISWEQPLSVIAVYGLRCLLIIEKGCFVLVKIRVLALVSEPLIVAESKATAFFECLHTIVWNSCVG